MPMYAGQIAAIVAFPPIIQFDRRQFALTHDRCGCQFQSIYSPAAYKKRSNVSCEAARSGKTTETERQMSRKGDFSTFSLCLVALTNREKRRRSLSNAYDSRREIDSPYS